MHPSNVCLILEPLNSALQNNCLTQATPVQSALTNRCARQFSISLNRKFVVMDYTTRTGSNAGNSLEVWSILFLGNQMQFQRTDEW